VLKVLVSQFPPEEYLGRYDAVLVDSSCVNVLAGVPLTSIEMVSRFLNQFHLANRHEAQTRRTGYLGGLRREFTG